MTTFAKPQQERHSLTIDQSQLQGLQQNPRKAATKAKEAQYNLDMMKRRLMVLQGQEDYHRYRTLDHEKRISRHSEIHQKMMREKQMLRKSLEKVNDKTWVKQKCEQIREQLKTKLTEAKKNLIEEKTDRTQVVNEESIEHENKIKEEMLREIEQNKARKHSVQNHEECVRQSVTRHIKDKIKRVKLNKSVDSQAMIKKAGQGEQELSRLVLYEQELIKKNSQSLQASQVMKRKFNDLFTTSSTRNNSILPEIKTRTNNSKMTNNSSQNPMI